MIFVLSCRVVLPSVYLFRLNNKLIDKFQNTGKFNKTYYCLIKLTGMFKDVLQCKFYKNDKIQTSSQKICTLIKLYTPIVSVHTSKWLLMTSTNKVV